MFHLGGTNRNRRLVCIFIVFQFDTIEFQFHNVISYKNLRVETNIHGDIK